MTNSPSQPQPEPLWAFRGYELKTSDFNTAMVHFYRAEIQRSNVWRQRLDTTTNWAIITAGGSISFALTLDHHHGAILISFVLIALFFLSRRVATAISNCGRIARG